MYEKEIWKPVPGYENRYEASDLGRVRALPRTHERRYANGKTRPYPTKLRVLRARFCRHATANMVHVTGEPGTGSKYVRVRTLVAAAFLGPCPTGMAARTIDGSKTNDRADNLYYCRQGRLSDDQVRELRRMVQRGHTLAEVAEKYGRSLAGVHQIIKRRTYAHVD